ncbi:PREDICTED: uncharacterized protein LOC106750299 isoform X6 [Dinoponera quadriceps]|uniref:Uncharacterized protein LOC106750299 isoform X6 n=1 Tax=Dinoponera quadriceps TaxID=609295 RepID=A0A6P3Y7N2_DINQU|nr:PREDICTED: uncharacterized protein LOC106750299 isoform X6 [Dinoponera quadriceps]
MSFVYVSRIKSQVRGLEIRLSRAGNPYDDICTVNGRGGEGNQRYVSAPKNGSRPYARQERRDGEYVFGNHLLDIKQLHQGVSRSPRF